MSGANYNRQILNNGGIRRDTHRSTFVKKPIINLLSTIISYRAKFWVKMKVIRFLGPIFDVGSIFDNFKTSEIS